MSSDNAKLPQLGNNNQVASVPHFEEVYQSYTENSDYNIKYSSGSSVYTTQSIANPDSNELIYVISSIIQSEMCDHLASSWKYAIPPYSNLHINTHLPAHLGGLLPNIPESLLQKEAGHDPELYQYLINNQVPTVDTVLRFITWLHQSAKFSAPCNIIAFIYIKRIISTRRLLSMNNWRGLWVGCIMIAQKFWDDTALRCSAFTTILPGVTSSSLQSIEICIFDLLEHSVRVKPSMYAKFYFELRAIFQSMVGSAAANFSVTYDGSVARPLSRVQGAMLLLQQQDRSTSATVNSSASTILSVASGEDPSPRGRPLSAGSGPGLPAAGSDQSVASQSTHSQSVTSLPSITSVSGRPLSQSQMHCPSQSHPQTQSEVIHDQDTSRVHHPHRVDSANSMHSASFMSNAGGLHDHSTLSRGGPHNSSLSTLSSSSGVGLSAASMESVSTSSLLPAVTATTAMDGTEHFGYGSKLPEIVRVSTNRRSAGTSEAGGNSGTISSHTATTNATNSYSSSGTNAGRHAMTVEDMAGISARSIFVIN